MTRAREAVPTPGLIRWPWAYEVLVQALTLGREGHLRVELVALGGVVAGESVLDVGCGTGSLLRAVRARVPDVGHLAGIEPAPEMAAHARRRAAGTTIEIQPGLAGALPFEDRSFDVVFCTFVVHHLPPGEVPAALGEMARVLRPGGRLVVADFLRGPGTPLGTRIHDAIGRLLHRGREPAPVPPFEVDALRGAGLDVIHDGRLSLRAAGVWVGVRRGEA